MRNTRATCPGRALENKVQAAADGSRGVGEHRVIGWAAQRQITLGEHVAQLRRGFDAAADIENGWQRLPDVQVPANILSGSLRKREVRGHQRAKIGPAVIAGEVRTGAGHGAGNTHRDPWTLS